MTNEIEKQFFDTFGIEKITTYSCYDYYTYERDINIWGEHCEKYIKDGGKCDDCDYKKFIRVYPQITDSILLELICIVLNVFETFEVYRIMDIASLKDKILKLSMLAKDDVYSQVRTLFEEG